MSQVTFGITKKRINSTSRQMNSGSVTLDCKLKEPCGTHNPVFIVEGLDDAHRWNYCSWRGAYYYIDEVIYTTRHLKEVHCRLDPLATFKGSIDDTYAFVNYGDAQHTLNYVDDPRFGPDHKIDKVDRQGAIDMGMDPSNWTIIMVVNAATDLAHNGVLTYAMTPQTCSTVLNTFQNTVMTDATTWTSGDFFEALQNIFIKIALGGGQAVDNIRSIVAVPFAYSSYTSQSGEVLATSTDIAIGPYKVHLNSGEVKVLSYICSRQGSAYINFKRPLVTSNYKWLNLPKYCSIQLGHPCGYTEINDVAFLEETGAVLYWSVCPINGEYCIKVTTSNKEDETVCEIHGNVSIDLSYIANSSKTVGDQMFEGITKAATYGLSTTLRKEPASVENYSTNSTTVTPTTTAAGNPSSRNIINTTEKQGEITHYQSSSGISGNYRVGSIGPSVSGGSLGTGAAAAFMASVGKAVYYNIEHYYPSIFEDGVAAYMSFCNNYGYPVGRYMRVGDNNGYVECAGASVGTGHVSGIPGATTADISTINSYLNTGIYIED